MGGLYERWVLPRLLDLAMRQPPITRQREKVVPRARGRVLEVGIGSGLNLAHYDRGRVEKLWALDPSPELTRVARRRAVLAGVEVDFVGLDGACIPLESGSVDTVLTTYTLCTIPDVAIALEEMRRVLRPDGRLIFAEHGRAPDAEVVRWQDRLNPLWKRLAGGCHLNRAVPELIGSAGFRLEGVETLYLPGPRPMTYNYWGEAVPA